MKIHKDIKDIAIKRPVLTMGTFDGLHIGHLHVLEQLKEIAAKMQGESVILTFWPHPRQIIKGGNVEFLNAFEEKMDLFERNNIDHLIIFNFDKNLALLTYQEFVKNILVDQIAIEHLIFGYDHRFGKNGDGTFDKLEPLARQYHFTLHRTDEVRIGHAVSSTRIRNALEYGHVDEARKMLGYFYQLRGRIVHGEQIGRKIGFPTANLEVTCPYKLIPGNGVYVCKAYLNGKPMPAMVNIGVRPTINEKKERKIEVHLIHFDGDLYDDEIRVDLIKKIREEKKFSSLKALTNQLEEDQKISLQLFKKEIELGIDYPII